MLLSLLLFLVVMVISTLAHPHNSGHITGEVHVVLLGGSCSARRDQYRIYFPREPPFSALICFSCCGGIELRNPTQKYDTPSPAIDKTICRSISYLIFRNEDGANNEKIYRIFETISLDETDLSNATNHCVGADNRLAVKYTSF